LLKVVTIKFFSDADCNYKKVLKCPIGRHAYQGNKQYAKDMGRNIPTAGHKARSVDSKPQVPLLLYI